MEFVNDSSGIGSSRNNEGANLLDPIGSKTQYHATSHLRATIYWHAVENDIRPKMYITYPTLKKTFLNMLSYKNSPFTDFVFQKSRSKIEFGKISTFIFENYYIFKNFLGENIGL